MLENRRAIKKPLNSVCLNTNINFWNNLHYVIVIVQSIRYMLVILHNLGDPTWAERSRSSGQGSLKLCSITEHIPIRLDNTCKCFNTLPKGPFVSHIFKAQTNIFRIFGRSCIIFYHFFFTLICLVKSEWFFMCEVLHFVKNSRWNLTALCVIIHGT
jgi:hypothetical protein